MSEDDRDARYDAMVEFLACFSSVSGNPPTSIEDLSDGVALFEALSDIAPDYFDPTTIARHLGDNWALKSSNLRKLLRNLEEFYHDSLGKDADFKGCIGKAGSIARSCDKEAIAELFELVAAAAVTCENRGEFVSLIMEMKQESQAHMKEIIESSLLRLSDYDASFANDDDDDELVFGEEAPSTGLDHDEDEGLFSGPSSFYARDGGRQELETSLMDARRELASHKSQASLSAEENEKSQKKLKVLIEDLQDRLEKRQEELNSVEERFKEASIELQESVLKVEELEKTNSELADDLDVANSKAEQLRKAEAIVVAYRKKLEGVGVMTQQMTDLEDQAASYLKQIVDLENDVKKIPTMQKTIDDLRMQVSTMERESVDVGSAVKGSASEIAKLKSALNETKTANKMYEEEIEELRAQQSLAIDDEVASPMAALTLSGHESAASKEKVMRLEIENNELKKELEKMKAGMEKQITSVGDMANGTTKKSVSVVENSSNSELQKQLKQLQDELAKKEAEKTKIGTDKEKLEAYTKRTLAKFQEKYLVALQECKTKLKEKQDKIEALESRSSSEKTAQKREERLTSSLVYELGLSIMQQRLKER
mmetsp:Transcript_12474/g.18306  ORF Transcript_12474/g.18306 Transcript_12474/m.18306 type:complete len:598 (-) Transcript_12474:2129-3922(-)|eukprot:CAMPEP_0194228508 /NCGR_PEP_ID=MMETSP0156-20130528/43404_1 /TAXON_ID=33649 /ORGANISM="Thalassionema nitzschioides, Strain L26-B" /LENGTH=597 /DNA_ID=CAMNT_0038961025 /DNA_START=69 /DNA_END=1862 /DNA_ORIENTATION=+